MCSAPDMPEPEDPAVQENNLLITEEEEDKRMSDASKRGTQGLQIGLNSGGKGTGLSI